MGLSSTATYVKRSGKSVSVRGSVAQSYSNPLTPDEADQLADEIKKHAADARNHVEYSRLAAYVDAYGEHLLRNAANNGWIDGHGNKLPEAYAVKPVVRLVKESN